MESNNFNPSILIVSLDCQIAMNFFEKILMKYEENNILLNEEISKRKNDANKMEFYKCTTPFHLETKYYSTKLNIFFQIYDNFFFDNNSEDIDNNMKIEKIEGIIFIENYEKDNINYIEKISNFYNPTMQTLILDSQKTYKPEIFSNDFFIEIVYENYYKFDSLTKNDMKKKFKIDEETEGIYRIFEIIECTMWTSMNTKNQNLIKKEKEKDQQNDNINKENININKKNEEKSKEIKKKNYFEKEEDEEADFDVFSNLLNEMKEIRNNGKLMNDNDRKSKAEDIIKKMMELCNDFDDENEDENLKNLE